MGMLHRLNHARSQSWLARIVAGLLAAAVPGVAGAAPREIAVPAAPAPAAVEKLEAKDLPLNMKGATGQLAEWLKPPLSDRAIRRDIAKFIRSAEPSLVGQATERLRSFDRPALVVWAREDRVMPPDHGRRLAELLPQGRLVEIEDSYTLIPLDQPARFADEVRRLVRDGVAGLREGRA